jgi:hypothetical protein
MLMTVPKGELKDTRRGGVPFGNEWHLRTSGGTPALKNTFNYMLVPRATLIDQYVPVALTQVAFRNTYIFLISGLRRGINEIALLWHFAQHTVIIPYRRFGTTYRSLL